MKIAIIGAGSSYSPELLEKLSEVREQLPVSRIALMDVDRARLEIAAGFCRRYADHLGLPVEFEATTRLDEALPACRFVITQIRVGGNQARALDERIPLSFGLVGQETTGAGGFMKALRTIPALLEIARAVERHCPEAWIINYTNPTGIVAEAVNRYANAKIAGLCAGGLFARDWTERALGVKRSEIRYDIAGLNHMNFSYNINVRGVPLTQEQFRLAAGQVGSVDPELIMKLGALPSPYLQYYFHTDQVVRKLKAQPLSRAEQVMRLEAEIYRDFADPTCCTKPESLKKRGGGGYSEIAMGVMSALYNDQDTWLVVNVPNQGVIDFLPDDAVIEAACMVNGSGIRPLAIAPVPKMVRGLISAVKNYEQLAVEAAVTGSVELAELALLAHPLVGDWELIKQMLPVLLKENARWLPNFNQ